MRIDTSRLQLHPAEPAHLLALVENSRAFEERSGLIAAEGLREFFGSDDVSPEWVERVRVSSAADPWTYGFFVIHRESGQVIGAAGFKGPPDESGVVEIAYGIVPIHQGQGYATEVAEALLRFAFGSGPVGLVLAHTRPEFNASARVLTKCGFEAVGQVVDPDDGPVWRWERSRPLI